MLRRRLTKNKALAEHVKKPDDPRATCPYCGVTGRKGFMVIGKDKQVTLRVPYIEGCKCVVMEPDNN